MKRIACLVALVVSISGCATVGGYEALLDTWVGNSENDLVASWGPPQNVYQMTNGKRVIEYSQSRDVQIGGHTYTQPKTVYHSGNINRQGSFNTYGDVNMHGSINSSGSYSGTSTQYVTKTTSIHRMTYYCKTSFTLSGEGAIETWRWEGNDCRARRPKKIIPKSTQKVLSKKEVNVLKEEYSEYYTRSRGREERLSDLRSAYSSDQISIDDFFGQRKGIYQGIIKDWNEIDTKYKSGNISIDEFLELKRHVKPDDSLEMKLLREKKEQGKLSEEEYSAARKTIFRTYLNPDYLEKNSGIPGTHAVTRIKKVDMD